MNRQKVLSCMKIVGYHNDAKGFARLWIENRVAKPKANEAWHAGVTAKKSGLKCTCLDCIPKGLS